MKALTICQPYPRLILLGEKPVENRTWYTGYRGSLLIHAGKSRDWLEDDDEREALEAGDPLVFGAIVACCTLADCVRIGDIRAGRYDKQYPQLLAPGADVHCSGPWCWILTNVRRLRSPIPWRGARGLFDVPLTEFELWAREDGHA